MAALPSGTVTFLFTDIEGSTARWEHQPEAMASALARHDVLLRTAIHEHDGHVVKTMGDAFHAVFVRAPDAVAAALDAQRRLQAEPWGEIGPIRVRMVVHTGAAEERDGDYYGPPLNRAARLMSAGHGGQILLTEVAVGLVRDALPSGASLLDLGEHRLKDLIRPERVSQVSAPELMADFPPLRTLDARPHNLSVQPTALLGRDGAVAEVRALFERGVRLVTLTGPGGTGKTRLSQQVAAELDRGVEAGVWLVELAPISDPALVPSTIAHALGLREFGERQALDVVREHVRSRSLLLLLDNFEQIMPAASVVADLLVTSPGLKVLVTSREPLRLRGEVEYAVPPLALPEAGRPPTPASLSESAAVALFVERASAVRAGFALTDANAASIAELCARLDGLPLAIELAAARTRLLTPQAMVSRLERSLPLLTGGARDLPARQQTLRDTIAWSHDLLDDAERRLFRRLSVFVGGWTLEAAEAVVGDGPGLMGDGKPVPWLPPSLTDTLALGGSDRALDVLSGLDSLVSKSLARLDEEAGVEPRFQMLETIREYGLEQLEASGEEAVVQRRHLLWCTDFAVSNESKIHSSAMLAWMDELALEHDNCRAALAWSLADPKTTSAETGLWLASALTTFWFMRGHIAEGVEWIERLLVANPVAYPDEQDVEAETPSSIVPPRPNVHGGHPRVVALLYLGVFAAFLGNTRRQASAREEALVCAQRFGDGHGASQALVDLGQVARFSGDLSRALALGEEGVSLARAIGDTFGIWRSHGNFGEILLAAGNIGRARGVIEESLAAARKLGGPWELARSLWRLGTAFWQQGDLDRATALLEEAVERFAAIGVRRGAHWTVMNLGQISLQRGDLARARRWFAESLTLSQVAAEHRHLLASFEGAAATLSAVSDDQSMRSSAAARMLGAAGALRAQLGQPIAPSEQKLVDQAEAGARAGLGDAAFEAARAEGAELSLDEAVDFAVMALAISPMPI